MSGEGDYFAMVMGMAGTIVGVALGYVASRHSRKMDDEQLARGYLLALQLDVIESEKIMRAYQTDGVAAPAGRCPTATWQTARVFLAGSRSVSAEDMIAVGEFFRWAEQFNYCLDRASNLEGERLAREHARAALKIEHALGRDGSRVNACTAARQALNRSSAPLQN